jgi:hypothetical protein
MKPSRTRTSDSGDLRRSRRLKIDRHVDGQLQSSREPIKLCDISSGGFAIETSFRVRPGEVLAFRFTSRDGSSFVLRATVAHSRRVSSPIGSVRHSSGLEFAANKTLRGQQAIKDLLEKVKEVLSAPRSPSA